MLRENLRREDEVHGGVVAVLRALANGAREGRNPAARKSLVFLPSYEYTAHEPPLVTHRKHVLPGISNVATSLTSIVRGAFIRPR